MLAVVIMALIIERVAAMVVAIVWLGPVLPVMPRVCLSFLFGTSAGGAQQYCVVLSATVHTTQTVHSASRVIVETVEDIDHV